jgi:hypothetical protein
MQLPPAAEPTVTSGPAPARLRPSPALIIAMAAAVLWLWICWCLFPNRGWNDVRLAPIFGLRLGLPLYAGAAGPLSTWMYGPLPLWLLWPATWAGDAGQALLIAGGINLGIVLGAVGLTCAFWPVPEAAPPGAMTRLMAVALTIVILPGSMWQFLQADNSAVAFGLVANLALVLSRPGTGRWGAALLAMAGLLCKQTSLGVPLAQLIWLGAGEGRGAVRDHALRLLACGAALGGLLLLGQDARAAWFNLVLTPGALPWTSEPWGRLWDMAPWLAIHLGAAAALWLWLRREKFQRGLSLPTLAWWCAWLPGLPSLLKTGGAINNLQSFPLWLPAAMVVTGVAVEKKLGAPKARALAAAVVVLVFAGRIARLPAVPWQPSLQLYREAADLARARPGQIWFPWHPLVTVFSERKLYHVEDGMYVRALSGRPITYGEAWQHLPPRMSVIALPKTSKDNWGVALSLRPKNARQDDVGLWTLYSWPPPAEK